MITISKQNKSSTESWKNKKIKGFWCTINIISIVAAVAGNFLNLDALNFKGTLIREGLPAEKGEIFNTTLGNLVRLSRLEHPCYEFVANPSLFVPEFVDFINPGTTGSIPLGFDFGGTIDLKGNDELKFEWSLSPTEFFQAGLDTTNSNITMDVIDSVDHEFHIPYTRVMIIETNQDNKTYSVGDNVTRIVIANKDKQSFATVDNIISTMSMSSNRVNRTDDWNSLMNTNFDIFADVNDASQRFQNWLYYHDHHDIDGVALTMKFKPGNVNAGMNLILYHTFYTDDVIMTKATLNSNKDAEHSDRKANFDKSHVAGLVSSGRV